MKFHFNIIIPSTPGSSKWPSLSFPYQNPVCSSPLPHTCYMPRPSHSSRFDHPNNVWWGVQIIKVPHYVLFTPLLLRPSYTQKFSSTPYSRKASAGSSRPTVWTMFNPQTATRGSNMTPVFFSLSITFLVYLTMTPTCRDFVTTGVL